MKVKKLHWQCEYFHKTTLFVCPKCNAKLRDYQAELQEKVKAVPYEMKVALLTFLKEGRTVGEAIDLADPQKQHEDSVWYKIIENQIETHEYSTFNFNAK